MYNVLKSISKQVKWICMTLAGAKLKAPLLRCILAPYGAVTTHICFTGRSPSPDSKPCAYMTSPSLLVSRWQMYMFMQLVVFHIFLLFADSVSFTGTLTASHHHVLSQQTVGWLKLCQKPLLGF